MNKRLKFITNNIGTRLRTYFFTFTDFFKLFILEMFKRYDKCICLDSANSKNTFLNLFKSGKESRL